MLKKRPFVRIILIFVITLAGLILVYPIVRETYLGFLVSTGNRFMSMSGKDALVKFKGNKESKDLDMVLYIGNSAKMKKDIKSAYFLVTHASTFYIAWIGLALMIALILASPVPILRKLIVLSAGILFVHVIVYMKLLIQVYYVCNHNPGLEILVLSPSHLKINDFLLDQFVDTIQPSLILVIILWLLITFTHKDYNNLMGLTQQENKTTSKAKAR
jgi:hypothetical protein